MKKFRSGVVLLAVLGASFTGAARGAVPCTDAVDAAIPTGPLVGLEGLYAAPSSAPTALVVMAHGYRNRSDSWVPHLRSAARDHGVFAFALDNSETGAAPANRGWTVRSGARESIQVAKYFLQQCQSLRDVPIVMFGISMGGNTAGLAVAAGEEHPYRDGPLFDHMIVVEGAMNAPETYLGARAAQHTGDPYIIGAREDFEAACGGTIEQEPACYRDLSVVARADEVASSGVKGVVVVHGLADGLVPYNQSREMTDALRARGVPTDMFTVLRRHGWDDPSGASTEGGTTIDGHVTGAVPGAPDHRPLAGHGWEGSTTHIVITTGFERLWALLDDGQEPVGHEFVVDAEAGTQRVG